MLKKKLTSDEMKTVFKMADCDMKISEVARELFAHRNTIIYRIERIKKKTGYDIRRFYDLAILLREVGFGMWGEFE